MSEDSEAKIIGCHNGGPGCWCRCGLLAYVDKRSGAVLRVEGNRKHPVSRGFICKDRVPHAVEWLYHPDQLKYPLKRVGEKGQSKWQRISWEQALDEITAKLKELIAKYGVETLSNCEGTYRSDLYWARQRFLDLLGSPSNIVHPGTICATNCVAIQLALLGANTHTPDLLNAKTIVLHSRNPPESLPNHWDVLMRRRKRGEQFNIIAFDPRFTESVRNSTIWLPVRPGTDASIGMAWIKLIIDENLYDRAFVEDWTNAPFLVQVNDDTKKMLRECDIVKNGSKEKFVIWDTVTKTPSIWNPMTYTYEPKDVKPSLEGTYRVGLADGSEVECKTAWTLLQERLEPCSLEWAEKISTVPKQKIIDSARMYATEKPSCVYRGVALDQIGRNCTANELVKSTLRTITGNLDQVGGDIMTVPGPVIGGKMFIRDCHLQLEDKVPQEIKPKQVGYHTYKIQTWAAYDITSPHYKRVWGVPQPLAGHMFAVPPPLLWRQIVSGEPYPIKAMIVFGGNPMAWAGNTRLVYKALKSLELLVVMEHWMTPTAELADYVLPAASKVFERVYCATFEDFHPAATVWEQAIEPMGERRSEYDFFRGLAQRFGLGEYFPWETLKEVAEYRLKPISMSFEEAVKRCIIITFGPRTYDNIDPDTGRPKGFATPTGKAESVYSTVFEQLGYDPLPLYEEPAESPVSTPTVRKDYPLILNTGHRFRPMFHSENRQWGMGLREQHPWPIVEINPHTARELDPPVADGDWAWIETRRGRITQRARLTDAIPQGVVDAEASWWYPELPGEEPCLHGVWISNTNLLTLEEPETIDKYVGNWQCRGLLCKVYKADGPPQELTKKFIIQGLGR